METRQYQTAVNGMTCRPCEDTISEAMLAQRGVLAAETSYWKSEVKVTYDPDFITEKQIQKRLCETGYPPCEKAFGGWKTEVVTAAAVLVLLWGLSVLKLPQIPEVKQGASLLMLFLTGLVTGTHCICMCGGIMLTQISGKNLQDGRIQKNAFWQYHVGRVLTGTLLGMIFGLAGKTLIYTVKMKSMIYTLCGLAVFIIALVMWGIFPGLRRVWVQIPTICRFPGKIRNKNKNRPFAVGVFTALMPCGASSAMWLYAASCGSFIRGGISMLFWGLGTVPVMGIFAAAGMLPGEKRMKILSRIGVILMLTMGLRMMINGIRLGYGS